jgi:hypothetical protein
MKDVRDRLHDLMTRSGWQDRAAQASLADGVVEIDRLRDKLKKIGEHPDTPDLIKQYAKGMLDGPR